MTVMSDLLIAQAAELERMIEPFVAGQVRRRGGVCAGFVDRPGVPRGQTAVVRDAPEGPVVSYGLSSYGYDLRVAEDFQVMTPLNGGVLDPKAFDPRHLIDVSERVRQHGYCLIPPHSFALARTVERLRIPRDVVVLCVGKSTYARVGIICNVTPFEAGWEGYATLEISNTSPLPAKVYANEGIVQAIFFRSEHACRVSYADRQGKYQNQGPEIVGPRV